MYTAQWWLHHCTCLRKLSDRCASCCRSGGVIIDQSGTHNDKGQPASASQSCTVAAARQKTLMSCYDPRVQSFDRWSGKASLADTDRLWKVKLASKQRVQARVQEPHGWR